MARKTSDPVKEPVTLSDADMVSQRSVSRRSLLGVLGIGAGVAATAAFGTAGSAPAADSDTKSKDTKSKSTKKTDTKSTDTKGAKGKKKSKPKEEADTD